MDPGFWTLGSRLWALDSGAWAPGRQLGGVWEASGRRLADFREAAGRRLGGTWQAAWAPGASWGPERHLLHKLVISLQFSDILRWDPPFRLHFGGLGVTIYCACAQKLPTARRASRGDVPPTLIQHRQDPYSQSCLGNKHKYFLRILLR